MIITPIYSTNFKKPLCKTVSMKGVDLETLILRLAVGETIEAISSSKKAALLERIQHNVWSFRAPNYGLEPCVKGIQAISKIPNSFYNKRGSFDTYVPFVSELRHEFIKTIPDIPDDNITLVHTKKDFINSLFNNGHKITIPLVKLFEKLNDNYYGSFKQEIMDKCFFSPQYNSMREFQDVNTHIALFNGWAGNSRGFLHSSGTGSCNSLYFDTNSPQKRNMIGHAFCNLELLSTLDKDRHSSYFKSRTPIINKNKECLLYNNASYENKNLYNEYITPLLSL